jgi:predicted DsbA family dithiol-disulfide isomerase
MKQDRTVERVAASKQEAEALQISSTPTLYVNGRLSRHDHENPDALEDAIKRLLNGKS